ncbi:MAG: LysR family transcriptional regulator [Hyphomicrobium sp.]|nr:LysR family transcriptional regulator [Hyphomicrobium sp.]
MSDRDSSLPFDLRSLEIFLAVCEAGAMASAARSLGLTQPAISLAIAELERKTSATLFDRSVRPLALTTAGGLLRARAHALIADARQIAPLLRETERGKLPAIRVGLVDSLSRVLALPLASYLSTRADAVAILSGLTASHAGELLTRRLDIFLGVDDLQDLPGLERRELIKEPYILALPKGTPPVRTLQDMKKLAETLPLIRFSERSQTGLDIERHLRRLGLDFPRGIEFEQPFGAAAMVAAGSGFAITTPLCLIEANLAKGSLTTGRLPGPQITRRLTLVARDGELGHMPRDLAVVMRKTLAERCATADNRIA